MLSSAGIATPRPSFPSFETDENNPSSNISKVFALQQRIKFLEKLSTKVLMENETLLEKLSLYENIEKQEMSTMSINPLVKLKANAESTLHEFMDEFLTSHNIGTFNPTATSKFVDNQSPKSSLGSDVSKKIGRKDESNHTKMVSLKTGDLVCLHHEGTNSGGYILGDLSLSTLGIKSEAGHPTNPRFKDGVFRLCSALNFRAKTERRKGQKARRPSGLHKYQVDNQKEIIDNSALFRQQLEEVQNNEYLDGLSRGEGTDAVKFGDVIQLQHVSSKKFLATHKTPAPMNPNCRRVSLKAGSHACHFRIFPRFKVRSIGSLVYAGDHIQLQSVKFPHLRLGVSAEHETPEHNDGIGSTQPPPSVFQEILPNEENCLLSKLPRFLRPPACLAHQAICEVNASMEVHRSFSVKLYFRPSPEIRALFTGAYFHLFHPEGNAFLQASADPDKGEILDATGGKRDPFKIKRYDGTRPHIPYLKNSVSSSADASNPMFLSAKAVWCFEPVDNTQCSEIRFNSPLRLKHVPSGKYVSVDSSKSTGAPDKQENIENNETRPEIEDPNRGSWYDVALVFDSDQSQVEGKFGSLSSVLFYLMPIDLMADTLQNGAAAVRLEHRAADGRTLYFHAPHALKSGINHTERPESLWGNSKERGFKICFSTEFSSLDVLRVQPLSEKDADLLSYFVSKIPLFKLYAYSWHSAALGNGVLPTKLTEPVVAQCIDLLNVLRKSPAPPRHGGSISENMKEAQVTGPLEFGSLHAGAANSVFQKMCVELKLFDSVFNATVAPYNYMNVTGKSDWFHETSNFESFKSVQMFLYVVLQCLIRDNFHVQKYMTEKYSQVWKVSRPDISMNDGQVVLCKRYELYKDLIIEHGAESLGAAVTLAQLLKSSESVIQRIVNRDLMVRFKELVANGGPELRFINLFNAICFIEGRPSRSSQEMCLRLLWMNEEDRYSFGVTFHELPRSDLEESDLRLNIRQIVTDGNIPSDFLGKTDFNQYHPVCVCWTGKDHWEKGAEAFWWSPQSMKMPVVNNVRNLCEARTLPNASFVPIEHVMWVLEPFRLCKAVTGIYWRPHSLSRLNNLSRTKSTTFARIRTSSDVETHSKELKFLFERHFALATYINAELELLTKMCKGRSYNCIWWIEKSFSYEKLLNMASNPLLPYSCNAAALSLVNAVYVDRFPHVSHAGTLPHKLWLFHDEEMGIDEARKSAAPVLRDTLDLHCREAFPAFFLPSLSSVFGHPNPVLSHPDHFKFYLLQKLYSDTIKSYGIAGRVIYGDTDFNRLGLAALQGQQCLLLFGFQSTYMKLKELCLQNALLLDGRSDLKTRGTLFEPPDSRFKDGGADSELVLQIKRELIRTFNEVSYLCTNFRLGQLLHLYKEKAIKWTLEECEEEMINPADKLHFTPSQHFDKPKLKNHFMTSAECPEAQYIMQTTDESVEAMYQDFEAMFPGGIGEAAQLDLKVLCDKPDLEVSLVDAIMYDDDELMAASLNLLDGIYGQRRAVRNAIKEVSLLDKPEIPVFGDVHVLKTQLQELMNMLKTSSSWGVSSAVAGKFGNKEFSQTMFILDRLHKFLFDDGKMTLSKKEFQSFQLPIGFDEVWSTDVAEKWSTHTKIRVQGSCNRTNASVIHQDLLCAVNLKEVLIEAILIDPLVARKDGTGTQEDMDESLRRLTMVMRAALSLASAFVFDNRKNQESLFQKVSYLEKLAIPVALSNKTTPQSGNETFSSLSLDDREWSLKLANYAQLLIFSILHKNKILCDKVDDSLPTLFSSIADMSEDLSTAPTLDIIFILVKPGRAPNSEVQLQACKYFLGFSRTNGLAESLALCMRIPDNIESPIREPPPVSMLSNKHPYSSGTEPEYSARENDDEKLDNANESQNFQKTWAHPTVLQKMEDPARLLRLMTALMEGGNERVANMLSQRAGLTIDLSCATLVSHVENELKKMVLPNYLNPIAEGEEVEEESISSEFIPQAQPLSNTKDNLPENVFSVPASSDNDTTPKTQVANRGVCDDNYNILIMLTEEDSIGAALFSLLIEQIFLLPLNRDQLYSLHLWSFLEKVAIPVLDTAGKLNQMKESISEAVGELVGAFEYLLITFVRLSLYERILEDTMKERVLNDLVTSVRYLLHHRQHAPVWLEADFNQAAVESGIEALNRIQFVSLMERTCCEYLSVEKSSTLTKEIKAAYDDAHVCGESGLIDLYEFIRLYKQLSFLLQSNELLQRPLVDLNETQSGYLLSLRTIECAERIDQIYKGNGSGLGLKKFSRNERYGTRVKQKQMSGEGSLFDSTHHRGVRATRKPAPTLNLKNQASKVSHKLTESNLGALRHISIDSTSSSFGVQDTIFSMQQKFSLFQQSISNNPLIVQALQRRRFSMLAVLEKGTPGPPENVGRDLNTTQHFTSNQRVSKLFRRRTRLTRSSVSDHQRNIPITGKTTRVHPLRSVDTLVDQTSKKRLSSAPCIPPSESHFLQQEKAAIVIESFYRQRLALLELDRRKRFSQPGDSKSANRLSGAVLLSWSDIAGRFIRYLGDHFWETGDVAKVNILIMETLLAHLIKARTHYYDSNNVKLTEAELHKSHRLDFINPHQLKKFEFNSYNLKKEMLNSLGLTSLLARILASLSDNVAVDALPDRVVQLLIELLDGGNKMVQQSLLNHLTTVDTEGKFLQHLEKRLQHSFGQYTGKKLGKSKSKSMRESLSIDVEESCEHLIKTFRLLQLFCEGHHTVFQNYLRVQSDLLSSQVNIVKTSCEFVILLCDSNDSIKRFSMVEVNLLSQILLFLIESIQGPCAGNQELIVKSDVVVALDSIIYSENQNDDALSVFDPHYMNLKSLAVILLAAALEGREDDVIHFHLDQRLEKTALGNFKMTLELAIRDVIRKSKHEGRLPTEEENFRIRTKQTALVALTTILIDLGHDIAENHNHHDEEDFDISYNHSESQLSDDMRSTSSYGVFVAPPSPLIGVVEVAWRGKVEKACFPIPFEVKYLPSETKHRFLHKVDMSSSEKRMSALIKKSYYFIAEMNLIYRKAESSRLFLALHTALPDMKTLNYGLIVALNMNILLAPNTNVRSPQETVKMYFSGNLDIHHYELLSVMVTIALSSFVTIMYAVIMITMAVIEIPTAIQQVNDEFSIARRKRKSSEQMKLWDVWGGAIITCFASVGFCGLHMINFHFWPEFYLIILICIPTPIVMQTTRGVVINYPRSKHCRYFAILYDCIFVKSFIRNNFVLTSFCFLGYFENMDYFTLELLDVVSISPIIADIIKSFISPGRALMLVFYLFCVTTYIWVSFGMSSFHASLSVPTLEQDGTTDHKPCGHTLQCFYFIFHEALSNQGKMAQFLAPAHVGHTDFPTRIVFDVVYVVWVGIILWNVITGLMVDTFTRVREEKQSRAISLTNECFVCGISRQNYEDLALGSLVPSFDKHIAEEHNPWIYLHYISYLKAKDPSTDSGIESYVRQQLDDQTLEWIPSKISYHLNLKKGYYRIESDTENGTLQNVDKFS